MGMKFALRGKAERSKRLIDTVRERRQCRGVSRSPGRSAVRSPNSTPDPGPENAGCASIREKAYSANRDLEARRTNTAKALTYSVGGREFAEKFQGDVISVAADKSHTRQARLKSADIIVEPLLDGFVNV